MRIKANFKKWFVGIAIILIIVLAKSYQNNYKPTQLNHAIINLNYSSKFKARNEIRKVANNIVKITTNPEFKYSFDIMKEGVLQHIDRNYTYDYIPPELKGGILFQGVHRPPAGTFVHIKLLRSARIYFFFLYKINGGYDEIFENLIGWKRCVLAPKYDIKNGKHGLNMIMYKLVAEKGNYFIPETKSARACFNIVIK